MRRRGATREPELTVSRTSCSQCVVYAGHSGNNLKCEKFGLTPHPSYERIGASMGLRRAAQSYTLCTRAALVRAQAPRTEADLIPGCRGVGGVGAACKTLPKIRLRATRAESSRRRRSRMPPQLAHSRGKNGVSSTTRHCRWGRPIEVPTHQARDLDNLRTPGRPTSALPNAAKNGSARTARRESCMRLQSRRSRRSRAAESAESVSCAKPCKKWDDHATARSRLDGRGIECPAGTRNCIGKTGWWTPSRGDIRF